MVQQAATEIKTHKTCESVVKKDPTTNLFKNIWLVCNILFVLNYCTYLTSFVWNKKVSANWINCTLLSIAYMVTVLQSVKAGGHYTENPNALSILFFMSFPLHVFLLPYFFLSVYHLIINAKKIFLTESINKNNTKTETKDSMTVFIKTFAFLYDKKEIFGDLTIYSSFWVLFVALFKFKISTFFFMLMIIRQQFHSNVNMEKFVCQMVKFLDQHIHKTPNAIQQVYLKMKGMSTNSKINSKVNLKVSEETKKNK